MLLGIDLGNQVTKPSIGKKFLSRVSNGHKEMNKDEIKVEYKGKKYTVGTKKGTPVLGINRINSVMYDICLLTAIAKSCDDELVEADIVVSLPPEQFESDLKDNLEKKLLNLGQQEIIVDSSKRYIRIRNAAVFSESSIVFKNPSKYRSSKNIIIDLGGGTTDVSQFDGLNLVKSITTDLGMLTLYTNMKRAINSKYTAKLKPEDMEELLGSDKTIIRQEEKDISFIKDIIQEHITLICNEVNQNFDIDNCQIVLIGGGAENQYICQLFSEEYPSLQVDEDGQYANAKTNETVGRMLWNECTK